MKLFAAFGLVAFALCQLGCQNDPDYRSGFTNGRPRGEHAVRTEASRPQPNPVNSLNRPVDPAGMPLDR